MNPEIESIIKNIALRDVHIAILQSEERGLIINKEEILIILDNLKKQYEVLKSM